MIFQFKIHKRDISHFLLCFPVVLPRCSAPLWVSVVAPPAALAPPAPGLRADILEQRFLSIKSLHHPIHYLSFSPGKQSSSMRKGQRRSGNRRGSFSQGFWWPKKKKWNGSESDRFPTTLCTKKCIFFTAKGPPHKWWRSMGNGLSMFEQYKFKPFRENRLQKTIHRIWRCWYWISSEEKDIFSFFTGCLVTKTKRV